VPTIDDKLDLFEKLIISDASQIRNAMLNKLHDESDLTFESIKEEIDDEAAQAYQKDVMYAALEKDSRLSKANINSRIMLMQVRNELLASVLDELTVRLIAFTKTAAYRDFLLENIRGAIEPIRMSNSGKSGNSDKTGNSNYTGNTGNTGDSYNIGNSGNSGNSYNSNATFNKLFLAPADFNTFFNEASAAAPGFAVLPGGDNFIGGVKAENAVAGIYVDNTIQKMIESRADELFQLDRKSTRLNSSHMAISRMPSSA
jgi:vacuolar-type H+-ATPase subunit E/Vma4